MDLTIDSLKIGSRLVFGKYGVHNDSPVPIVWLKASPNCDFITECVLDYLCFDAREPTSESRLEQYSGNPRFSLSNIFSFLNSDAEQWFSPSHPADCPPDRRYSGRGHAGYAAHYGFLYYFEEYETESLVRTRTELEGEYITSVVRLPQEEDIAGLNRFKLFSKKGIRPEGTDDMLCRGYGFTFESYIPFWLTNRDRDVYVKTVSRNGGINYMSPCDPCGIRPICSIKPDTVVTSTDGDMFVVKPYTISQSICTDAEFLDFLGLARP